MSSYPTQQPYLPPQAPQPPKTGLQRIPIWGWIVGGVIGLCLVCGTCTALASALNNGGGAIASTPTAAAALSTSAPQVTATPKPQSKTVLSLSGTGDKSSKVFHVEGDWTVKWTCNNNMGVGDWPFSIFIYPQGENQIYYDTAAGSCPEGKHTDSSEEHQSGDYYLKVIGGIPWSISVTDIPG